MLSPQTPTALRALIFLVACLYLTPGLQAQDEPFSKVIHYNNSTSLYGMSLTASVDSGWLMVGLSGELIRLDESGNIIDGEKLICNDPGYAEELELRDIIATPDSGYLLVGTARNENFERTEGIIIKIHAYGYVSWSKMLYDEDNVFPMHISRAIDSGYVITGRLTDKAYLDTPKNEAFFCQVNDKGELEWFKKGYSGNLNNIGTSIKSAGNGYMATGYYTNADASWSRHSYVLHLDRDGGLIWANHYETEPTEYNYNIAEDVLINSSGGLVYLEADAHVFIVQIDTAGKILDHWRYKWMPAGRIYGEQVPFNHINRTPDGGIVFTYGNQWNFGGILKTDSAGNKLFSKELVMVPVEAIERESGAFTVFGRGPILFPKKSNDDHHITGIIQLDASGNGVDCVAGYASWNPDKDSLVAKPRNFILNDAGAIKASYVTDNNLPGLSSTDGCISVSGNVEEEQSKPLLQVYPVPARGTLTVELMKEEPGTFYLYNSLGILLKEQHIDRQTTVMQMNDVPPGICIYRFKSEKGQVVTGKFLRLKE